MRGVGEGRTWRGGAGGAWQADTSTLPAMKARCCAPQASRTVGRCASSAAPLLACSPAATLLACTAACSHSTHVSLRCPAACSLAMDPDRLKVEALKRLKGEAEGEGRRKVAVSAASCWLPPAPCLRLRAALPAGVALLRRPHLHAPACCLSDRRRPPPACPPARAHPAPVPPPPPPPSVHPGPQEGRGLRSGGVLPRPVRRRARQAH